MSRARREDRPRGRSEAPSNSLKSAADIDREAREVFDQLKDVLSAQPPWSKDVELYRQKTRDCFLSLLFGHPLSTYSQSLDPMWHQTSYILISSYRSHTARLESDLPPLANRKRQANNQQFIELKKVLTRFRQCLQSEESFYRSLISRLVNFYQLQSLARDQLKIVTIPLADEVENGGTDHGLAPDLGPEQKREKLALVYKALICLGDLERYKEQYEDRARKEAREGRVSLAKLQERYNKAWTYYEVARALVPEDGSAFNQLAVISSYLSDGLLSTYYYLRALAVKHAFKNIHEIMDKFFRKTYEKGAADELERRKKIEDEQQPSVESYRADLLLITAILYRRVGLSALPNIQARALASYSELLTALQFPSEAIVKVVVIAIGVHWHARQSASMGSTESQELRQRRQVTEMLALAFLLELSTKMFSVAASEVDEALQARAKGSALADAGEDELHQYISAPLRRMLPSLRILSKWLKLHLDYVNRYQSSPSTPPPVLRAIGGFWESYKYMMLNMATFFPIDHLPSLVEPLEEDADMRGFIPLSRGMATSSKGQSLAGEEAAEPVHPNEEQLMRIADLQVDAKLIAQTSSGTAMMRASAQVFVPQSRRDDPELASVSTETEDDPVNLAMRAALGESSVGEDQDFSDDEEVILWGGRSGQNAAPQAAARTTAAGRHTAQDLLQNLMLESTPSPVIPNKTSPLPHSHSAHRIPQSSPGHMVPQGSPGLLFGGDGGGSIWTMGRQESQRGHQRLSGSGQGAPPRDISSIWAEPPAMSPWASGPGQGQTPKVAPIGAPGPIGPPGPFGPIGSGPGPIGAGQPWKAPPTGIPSPRQAVGAEQWKFDPAWPYSGAVGDLPGPPRAQPQWSSGSQFPR